MEESANQPAIKAGSPEYQRMRRAKGDGKPARVYRRRDDDTSNELKDWLEYAIAKLPAKSKTRRIELLAKALHEQDSGVTERSLWRYLRSERVPLPKTLFDIGAALAHAGLQESYGLLALSQIQLYRPHLIGTLGMLVSDPATIDEVAQFWSTVRFAIVREGEPAALTAHQHTICKAALDRWLASSQRTDAFPEMIRLHYRVLNLHTESYHGRKLVLHAEDVFSEWIRHVGSNVAEFVWGFPEYLESEWFEELYQGRDIRPCDDDAVLEEIEDEHHPSGTRTFAEFFSDSANDSDK